MFLTAHLGLGGVLAVIYHNALQGRFNPSSNSGYEVLDFSFTLVHQHTFRGTLIYRPPGLRSRFTTQIGERLEVEISASTYTVLGDFNFHLEAQQDLDTITLLDLM